VVVVIESRLAAVRGIPLSPGSHPEPPDEHPPGAFCAMEKWAYVTGQRWTDDPENCCPTIGGFLRRYNDTVDQAGRDGVDVWAFENADQIAATAHDGHRLARAFLAADWAVRTALPVSLDVAGIPTAAERFRRSPEIVDARSAQDSTEVVNDVRQDLPGWWAWRSRLSAKVRAALPSPTLEEAAIDEIVAGAALATVDAAIYLASVDAAATAAALGAAAAAAATDAVAGCTADAANAAGLDTAARYAAALARCDPPADAQARWTGIYGAVNPPVHEWLVGLYGRHWEKAGGSFHSASLGLLERMISIGRP
jgi:hypothetical protein